MVNGRQFVNRIKAIVLSNLTSLQVYNSSGWILKLDLNCKRHLQDGFLICYRKMTAGTTQLITIVNGRRGGLVVERRTPEREVGGSILTRVAVLYP